MAFKTYLVFLHLLGVVCGVGGVLILDLQFLKFLRGARVGTQDAALARHVSVFVKGGLIAVWLTGLAIIATAPDGPAVVLSNPKLQAKLVVVVVLTLNALFIESLALPLLSTRLGQPLFAGVSPAKRAVILVCSAVSAISWMVPIVLGIARELNQVVPAQIILGCYLAALAATAVIMQGLTWVFYRPGVTASPKAADGAGEAQPEPQAVPVARVASGNLAWQAGFDALRPEVSPAVAATIFDSLSAGDAQAQFRRGMFEALRMKSGADLDVDAVTGLVAASKDLQVKLAVVAPGQGARDAFLAMMTDRRELVAAGRTAAPGGRNGSVEHEARWAMVAEELGTHAKAA